MPYRRVLIPAALLIAAAVVIGTLLFVWRPFETATALRTTPSVVLAVRDLARLETAEYHIERVIDLRDRQSLLFGLIRTQDAILFVAVGQVTAGVDLGALADGDVVVDQARTRADVTLPAAIVFSTRLDNAQSWSTRARPTSWRSATRIWRRARVRRLSAPWRRLPSTAGSSSARA
jgi:hypothetical protein